MPVALGSLVAAGDWTDEPVLPLALTAAPPLPTEASAEVGPLALPRAGGPLCAPAVESVAESVVATEAGAATVRYCVLRASLWAAGPAVLAVEMTALKVVMAGWAWAAGAAARLARAIDAIVNFRMCSLRLVTTRRT